MSNKKTKWTEENEYYLLKLLTENNNLKQIIKKTQKTEKEIIDKLKKIGLKMLYENKNIDEISNTLKILSEEQINNIVKKYNKIKNKIINENSKNIDLSDLSDINMNNSKDRITIKKMYILLKDINQKMNLLLSQNNTNNMNNMNKHKNNVINKDTSSSFITSGDDSTEIINLIHNRINEVNQIRTNKKLK